MRSLELRKTAVHRLAPFRQHEVGDQLLLVDRVESVVDLRVHRFHAAAGGQDAERRTIGMFKSCRESLSIHAPCRLVIHTDHTDGGWFLDVPGNPGALHA